MQRGKVSECNPANKEIPSESSIDAYPALIDFECSDVIRFQDSGMKKGMIGSIDGRAGYINGVVQRMRSENPIRGKSE